MLENFSRVGWHGACRMTFASQLHHQATAVRATAALFLARRLVSSNFTVEQAAQPPKLLAKVAKGITSRFL